MTLKRARDLDILKALPHTNQVIAGAKKVRKQLSKSMVKAKFYQLPTTSSVNQDSYSYTKLHQFPISSFRDFLPTDTQTDT